MPITNQALKRLFAIARDYRYSYDDIKEYIRFAFGLDSTKNLNSYQYDQVIGGLRDGAFGQLLVNYKEKANAEQTAKT